jgi:hypothetical protein
MLASSRRAVTAGRDPLSRLDSNRRTVGVALIESAHPLA